MQPKHKLSKSKKSKRSKVSRKSKKTSLKTIIPVDLKKGALQGYSPLLDEKERHNMLDKLILKNGKYSRNEIDAVIRRLNVIAIYEIVRAHV